MRFVAGFLRERAQDWWEEFGYTFGAPTIEATTWPDFVTRFRVEFAPAIEVKKLAKEFLDM